MNYLIRRILQLIPTFIIATMIAFILFSLVGDPFEGMRQDPRLASQVERLRKIYGYDKDPLHAMFCGCTTSSRVNGVTLSWQKGRCSV